MPAKTFLPRSHAFTAIKRAHSKVATSNDDIISRPHKKRKCDHTSAVDLDQPHRYTTRRQIALRRSVFPFFKLPRELRDMIYELCVDVTGVERIIGKHYEKVKDTKDINKEKMPTFFFYTPQVFHLCKQSSYEVLDVLRKRKITLSHGLLDFDRLADLGCAGMFRNLSSIEINDCGHSMFKRNIRNISITGYTVLISQLAAMLSEGDGTLHHLKSFKLILNSPNLAYHMNICWFQTWRCGVRNNFRHAFNRLRGVRNVKEVTIGGVLPESVCRSLKARMESSPPGFLDLPLEVRNRIFTLSRQA